MVSQKPGPPWARAQPKLNIMASFTDDGQCIHLAPIGTVRLGPQSTLEYCNWMVLGNKAEIVPRLNALLAKHKDEKFKLTDTK